MIRYHNKRCEKEEDEDEEDEEEEDEDEEEEEEEGADDLELIFFFVQTLTTIWDVMPLSPLQVYFEFFTIFVFLNSREL